MLVSSFLGWHQEKRILHQCNHIVCVVREHDSAVNLLFPLSTQTHTDKASALLLMLCYLVVFTISIKYPLYVFLWCKRNMSSHHSLFFVVN